MLLAIFYDPYVAAVIVGLLSIVLLQSRTRDAVMSEILAAPTEPSQGRRRKRDQVVEWAKQSAALFQALSCRTAFTHNVAYNGPRAAININDGFCGGTHLEANVLFNWVRPRSAPRRAHCSQHDSPC